VVVINSSSGITSWKLHPLARNRNWVFRLGLGLDLHPLARNRNWVLRLEVGFGLEKEPIADFLQRKQEAAAE
jgi:hypothetical protein